MRCFSIPVESACNNGNMFCSLFQCCHECFVIIQENREDRFRQNDQFFLLLYRAVDQFENFLKLFLVQCFVPFVFNRRMRCNDLYLFGDSDDRM